MCPLLRAILAKKKEKYFKQLEVVEKLLMSVLYKRIQEAMLTSFSHTILTIRVPFGPKKS